MHCFTCTYSLYLLPQMFTFLDPGFPSILCLS